MIIGKIPSKKTVTDVLPTILKRVINLLENTKFNELENERYEIIKDKVYLVLNKYETKQVKEKKAEQHRDWIDFQYIISGKEKIGLGYYDKGNKILDKYDPAKDSVSFTIVKNEIFIGLIEGMYAIVFPGEIHRPGLNSDGRQAVRKAVVKINKLLLDKKKIGQLKIIN